MKTRLIFMAILLLLQLIIQRFTMNVLPDYANTVKLKTKKVFSSKRFHVFMKLAVFLIPGFTKLRGRL